MRATVTHGEQIGSATKVLSCDAIAVCSIQRSNTAQSGAVGLTLRGESIGIFSFSQFGRVGSTACELSFWDSETSITCRSSSSASRSKHLTITTGSVYGSTSVALSACTGSISESGHSNTAATGSLFLSIYGQNLGSKLLSLSLSLGRTDCAGSGWMSQTAILCLCGSTSSRSQRLVVSMVPRTSQSALGNIKRRAAGHCGFPIRPSLQWE